MNLCIYNHSKFECNGKDRQSRRSCKFFPMTMEDCPDFDKHGCRDCDCFSAQCDTWALHPAALETRKE